MRKSSRFNFKTIIYTTLFTLFVSFVMPSQHIITNAKVNQVTEELMNFHEPTIQEPSGDLGQPQTVLGTLVNNLDQQYQQLESNQKQNDIVQLRKTIHEMNQTIHQAKKELVDEWKSHEKTLKKAGSTKGIQRLKDTKNIVDSQFVKLEETIGILNQLAKDENSGQSLNSTNWEEALSNLKEQIAPEKPYEILGNELPHRPFNLEPEEVILGQESGTHSSQTTDIEIAYIEAVEPTDADVQETIETKWTEQIEAVAEELGKNPLEIYEFVRHTVTFEPYYGSRKGALGTLEERSGNDIDQASLLISLLRYHDIPARYAHGTIEVPIERAMKWVGAETPEAAARILASLGTPVSSLIKGGKISAIQVEHVWVEAYVPYDEYRGIGEQSGTSTWVPLDPSFVQQEYAEGLNLEDQIDVDIESILDEIHNNSERSADLLTTTNIPTNLLEEELESQYTKLQSYLEGNVGESSTITDIIGGWKVTEEHLGVIPLSLPYTTVEEYGVFSQIPESLAETVNFQIKGASPFSLNWTGSPQFDYTKRAAELFGKRITLSYQPATTEDREIIKAYGGIFQTPVHLIKLIPVLTIDGEVVAEGEPVGAGFRQSFDITLSAPRIGSEVANNTVTAGGFYSTGLDYGSVSESQLQSLEERMTALKETSNHANMYTDEVMGEFLHGVVQAYLAQVDLTQEYIGQQFNVNSTRLLGETTTGYEPQVKYFFMSPVEMGEGNLFVDVNRNVVAVNSRNNDQENKQPFMIAGGVLGSALEHRIFEQLLGTPSVSTIKIFEEANARGILSYTINSGNMDEIMPRLNVSQTVKNDIRNAVRNGNIVTIPEEEIRYFDWKGSAYLVLDPDTGSAAYRIAGGINGGSTGIPVELATLITAIDALSMLYSSLVLLAGGPLAVIGGIILLAITVYFIATLIHLSYQYYVLGDESAGDAIITEAIWSLVGAGGGFALSKLPRLLSHLSTLMDNIKRFGDAAAGGFATRLATNGYSDDFIYNFIKNNGSKNLHVTENLLKQLDEAGISKDFINHASHLDNQGLNSLLDLVNKGYDEAQLTRLMGDGFKLDDILFFANRNIDPSDYSIYGITSRTEATWVKRFIQDKGFTPDHVKMLVDKNVSPSEFNRLRLNNPSQIDHFVEALEAGVHRSGNFGPSYQENLSSLLSKHNISIGDYNRLSRTTISRLTDAEIDTLFKLRLDVDFPTPSTIMQKVITPSSFDNYINGKYKIRGFVARAQDVNHLNTPEEIVDGLALHYRVGDNGEKAFTYSDYSVGIIRYPADHTDIIKIPLGGNTSADVTRAERILNDIDSADMNKIEIHKSDRPFTGNGITLSDNHRIVEFKYADGSQVDIPPNGAEMYEFTRTGHKILIAVFNRAELKWVKAY
ncbi:transglutaminase-like domain-containing protein [Bacillus sp. JJ1533]|uniref:transglutaminase-like domain-containing protein n=1 Tax=Bacillus sp. JJ1533 TaxID=3122959 RepID=UPI002FFDD40F